MTIRKGSNIIAGTSQGDLNLKANTGLNNLDAAGQAVLDAKANDNAVVHKTGNEEIGGFKNFTGGINLPGENIYIKQASRDREGGEIKFEVQDLYKSTIGNNIVFDVYENTMRLSNEGGSVGLSIPFTVDFQNKCLCANPSALIGSVVTTTGINKAQNGYVKLGNGLIIQWGLNTNGEQVTFPMPFTTNPKVSICGNNTSGNTETTSSAVGTVSTTGFKLLLSRGGWSAQWIAIGY